MLRIGYFGDGLWASRALAHIAARPDIFSVAFITPRFDTQDPALKDWAKKLGVPFLPCENVNDPSFMAQIASYGCDLLVSMSFNRILKEDIIKATPKGFINCHAGALPFYRGRNPLNWVLINGEKEFGVTVHYVDAGIDTGDILVQNKVPVTREDHYATLLEKAHESCAQTLLEALSLIESGREQSRKQKDIDPVGFYCGRRREGDEWIDWQSSSEDILNFIRALNAPGPGARSLSEKGEIALLSAAGIPDAPVYKGTCGEVVGRAENGVIVKTGDSTILVKEAAMVGEGGTLSDPFLPRWRIGTRLGLSPLTELHRLHKVVAGFEDMLVEMRREINRLKEK
ncbi:MAG: formyl transferase [Alphaproteobacteria bacterium CG_4_9_14_3_um_filter_47_13]|nr:MAG: formyl transferase [Alphaproteobacteria bacterium CG_4_9_14_3_um_filter_47_13]